MNNNIKQRRSYLIAYFVLAASFALLAIFVSKPLAAEYPRLWLSVRVETRWLFWMLLSLSFGSLIPLLAALVRALPRLLDLRSTGKLGEIGEAVISRMRATFKSLPGTLCIVGVAILVLISLLSRTGAVRDDEINDNLYETVRAYYGGRPTMKAFAATVRVHHYTQTTDRHAHLRDYLDIAETLKRGGAKVVLIPLEDLTLDRETLDLLRSLEKTEIVVFGMTRGTSFTFADSTGEVPLSRGALWTDQHELWKGPTLSRVELMRHPVLGSLRPFGDVTLEMLRKFQGYPVTLAAERDGNQVRLGDLAIPVSKTGWIYCRDRFTVSDVGDLVVHRGESLRRGVSVGGRPMSRTERVEFDGSKRDTLKYMVFKRPTATEPSPWLAISPLQLQEKVKGKMVLLTSNAGKMAWSMTPDRAYAVSLESIVTGAVLKRSDTTTFWMCVLSLLLAGFVAYRFPPIQASLFIFLLGALMLFIGTYLYIRLDTMIDIFYPLMSTAMAMMVFPIVRVVVVNARSNGERL